MARAAREDGTARRAEMAEKDTASPEVGRGEEEKERLRRACARERERERERRYEAGSRRRGGDSGGAGSRERAANAALVRSRT